MKKSTLLFFLFSFLVTLFLSVKISAQQNVEFTKDNFKNDRDGLKEAKRNISLGDESFEKGDIYYRAAIGPYLKANEFNPNNALLNFKIGKCYFNTFFKTKSLTYLEKALQLDPNVDPQ